MFCFLLISSYDLGIIEFNYHRVLLCGLSIEVGQNKSYVLFIPKCFLLK